MNGVVHNFVPHFVDEEGEEEETEDDEEGTSKKRIRLAHDIAELIRSGRKDAHPELVRR